MYQRISVGHILPRRVKPLLRRPFRCFESTTSTNPQNARMDKIIARLPRSLQRYTARLRDAPVSHVVAFLILHEVTAIVPLVGLTQLFHITGWIPEKIAEGEYMGEAMERFGRYFRRKRWFGFGEGDETVDGFAARADDATSSQDGSKEDEGSNTVRYIGVGAKQFLVEVAAAYVVTKALLPARVILSVWATPWFARVFVAGISGRLGKLFGRRGGKVFEAANAAVSGTVKGAVGSGAGKGL